MAEARDFVFKTEMELMCYLEFDACFASAHDFLLTYFQLLHFYHRDIPHIEPSNYELPIHNESLESLKLCAEKFARSSGVMARAVWDYPAVKFNNSVLAAAIFYWAYDDLFEMNEETFKMITGYSSSKIRSAVDFVGNLPRQSEVDLRQEFPDYGTMGQEPYDIVFHQSETSLKTLEEAVCFLSLLHYSGSCSHSFHRTAKRVANASRWRVIKSGLFSLDSWKFLNMIQFRFLTYTPDLFSSFQCISLGKLELKHFKRFSDVARLTPRRASKSGMSSRQLPVPVDSLLDAFIALYYDCKNLSNPPQNVSNFMLKCMLIFMTVDKATRPK